MFAEPATCGVVIPCHNEASSIASVVCGIRSFIPWVLVVDDGSTDATGILATRAGARLLSRSRRGGKGQALRQGWTAARDAGFEWVLMLDGDGQHAPEEAPRLLAAASLRRPLIIGNRLPATAMPWLRRSVNSWMSRRLSRVADRPLPDSQCGYRLAHLPTLLDLDIGARHFEIESEMCLAFARAGLAVEFVPITARYGTERSKIRPILDSWRWCRWYLSTRRSPATRVPGRTPVTAGSSVQPA
ncbi:MAG: glycosyltransferase family 2 protein [Verrucomicrobia bacterium]|nr:glycosyltransferase family 2 protein [Verrucomicrobiota bacterium]